MTFDDRLRRAFDPLPDRLRDEIARQIDSTIAELSAVAGEQIDAAGDLTGAEICSADPPASERLIHAIRSIDRARSLTEILDVLVGCVSREATRVGVLLVRDTTLRGWRFSGFGPAFDDGRSVAVRFEDAGALADAVRANAAVSGNDQAVPPFARPPDRRECLAAPVAMAGQVVAVVYADQDGNLEARLPGPAIEVMVRHAARCLEALTAIKAARALSEPRDADRLGPAPARNERDEHEHEHEHEEEELDAGEADAAARRYAKLLISEIRLHHEPAIAAGRRERDLATRLAGEIARARLLYEQRVPAEIRQRTDYFQEEVVRTLADGDPTLVHLT